MSTRKGFQTNRTTGTLGATYTSPLADVICKRGDIQELAKALEVADSTVDDWLTGRRQIPEHRVPDIERVTGIKAHVLRPDIWRADGRKRQVRPYGVRPSRFG